MRFEACHVTQDATSIDEERLTPLHGLFYFRASLVQEIAEVCQDGPGKRLRLRDVLIDFRVSDWSAHVDLILPIRIKKARADCRHAWFPVLCRPYRQLKPKGANQ